MEICEEFEKWDESEIEEIATIERLLLEED